MTQEILKLCMGKGFLVDKEMLQFLSGLTEEGVISVIDVLKALNVTERVITKKLFENNFDKIKDFLIEERGGDEMESFFSGIGFSKEESLGENTKSAEELVKKNDFPAIGRVKLLSAPAFPQKKVEVKDFVNHFRSRYEKIRSFLEQKDFENLSSLRKIGQNRGSYTIIAAIAGKRTTKNKNLFLEVEDLTGTSIVLVNQNKKEVFEKAKDLLLDDIVAFEVSGTSEMLFANNIVFPEARLPEKRYAEIDEYVAFVSDIHFGSTLHLEKNFLKFVKWINGEEGDEKQRNLAKKIKYLLILGDNIDGVSVYPNQETRLLQHTTREQYKKAAETLKLIRKDIIMVMIPGQHDSVWVGEPQPLISEEISPELYELENLHLVPNPSLVEIDGGFKILMYHGAGMNYLIEEIPDIRLNYGHKSPTRVVKEMIKRRHLNPIHGFADYIPCENDPLIIDIVPDIIATGDQHRSEVGIHNNILMIASSCFQSITPFEERVGNVPDPCKVPLFNLKTREIKILDFSDADEKIEETSSEELSLEETNE